MKLNTCKLGIIGGGQLGMFLAKEAKKINIEVHVYSNTHDAPAKKYAKKMYYGSFDDSSKLINFFKKVDAITYEFENISVESLKKFNKKKGVWEISSNITIKNYIYPGYVKKIRNGKNN